MRRLFWLALGASLGVLVFRKLSRAAQRMTPQGIAGSIGAGLSDLGYSLREFTADVRAAMSAQEAALRAAAGLDSGSPDASSTGGAAKVDLIDGGTAAVGPAADDIARTGPATDGRPSAGA